MIYSTPPNSLQVPLDTTSSNNPSPPGLVLQPNANQHSIAMITPSQSKTSFSFKNTFLKERVIDTNKKQVPTKEIENDVSLSVLEAI